MCCQIWPLPETRVHKTRNSKPHRRTVTVTATDYEFQRAVLCCLAACWSFSCTLMQSPAWAAPPMCQCACASRLMQASMHQTSLPERLLSVRHHLGQCPVAITLKAGVPSTVQCRCEEASRCNKRAWFPKHGRQNVRYVQRAQTSPAASYMLGCAGQLCSNNPVAVVKTR
jgi:hypothetical protein